MRKEKKDNNIKSKVGRNMILNVLKTLMSIVFPLITYPYATRILGVENFGKVNYGQSIISYIALVAALGIATYAIREGGVFRKKQAELEKFGSEVFSINLLTTAIAYIILIVLVLVSEKMNSILLLLAIQSLSIFFTTVAIDWMNVIFEDYVYITIRSLITQVVTLIALFIFVRSQQDYYQYAALQVGANAVIAILNWTHLNKKCKLRITTRLNLKQHSKPILVLFSNSVAVSIYLNLDNVMLGWMLGNYYVGLYSVSVKIYTILKQIVSAIYSVVITRMTEYITYDRIDDYKKLLTEVISNLFLIAIPMSIGLACVSKTVTFFIAGSDFVSGFISLQILAVTIPIAVFGGALAYCVNLPLKREQNNLIATSIGAVENIVLNIWLIPQYNLSLIHI